MTTNSKIIPGNVYLSLLFLSLITMFFPPFRISIGESTLTIYIGEIFFWLISFLWIISILKRGKMSVTSIGKYSFLFVLAGIPSVFYAENIGRYLIGTMVYLELCAMMFMFSNIELNQKLKSKYMKYYVYAACVLAISIISKTLLENKGAYIMASKIKVDVGGSNYLASILLIPFFICLTSTLRNKMSLVNLFLVSLFGGSIIFTASRTALIIMIVLSLYYGLRDTIFTVKRSFTKKAASLILFLSAAWMTYKLGNTFLSQMIESGRFNNLSQQNNLLSRFEIFRVYFNSIQHHLVFGNGYMNTKGTLYISVVNPVESYFQAHDFILQILGDSGFFALIIFIGMLTAIFKFLRNTINISTDSQTLSFVTGYRRGFVAVLLHGLLEPNFGSELFMLYLFMGLGIIIASTSDQKINDSKKEAYSVQKSNQIVSVV